MKPVLFAAIFATIFIPLTGCNLLSKKQTRNPQGFTSAVRFAVKAGNKAAEALRRGEKDMEGKNLQTARLQNLDLSGRNLKNADLEEARLQGTVWKGTQAQGAVLKKCRCQGADFEGAILREEIEATRQVLKATFKKAKLQRANMRDLDLQDLDFRGANVEETRFAYSKLQGADFRGAKHIDKAMWKGAVYNYKTRFPDGFIPQERGMIRDLAGENLRGQYVGDWDIEFKESMMNWSDAIWRGAIYRLNQKLPTNMNPIRAGMVLDLSKSDAIPEELVGVNFWNADMSKINLQKRELHDANFSRTANLEEADLTGSFYDLNTKFPEGFVPAEHGMILDLRRTPLRELKQQLGQERRMDFRRALFGSQDLQGADLYKRLFHGADLSQVRYLERAGDLRAAWYDVDTKFPRGFVPAEHGMILDLKNVDIDRRSLYKWENMDFRNAVFGKQDLGRVQFSSSPSHFGGAYLGEVRNLDIAFLRGVRYNNDTVFPNGFDPQNHGMILDTSQFKSD